MFIQVQRDDFPRLATLCCSFVSVLLSYGLPLASVEDIISITRSAGLFASLLESNS